MGRLAIDEVGNRYGRLTVIGRIGSTKRMAATWLCKCDCGQEVGVVGDSLRQGRTQSCGCFQKERSSESRKARSLPPGEAAFNRLVSGMKSRAIQRNLIWDISDLQIKRLTSQTCHYCGAEPAQILHGAGYNGDYIYNGVDRVNNNKGYLLENVVSCCKICNYAKRTMTRDDFLAWISRIYKHSVLKEKDETLP